ncbi:hypothetical protein BCR39DRAFT_532509 [Naematelia encephala]|uniref:Uncharacterized protein n=1 Tax=Naematelia encephala TaxID=71784 RepID=A0A1Y2B3E9_9TREE|nr:hypothetical protein BCR39DRAFT_532509 [Naematelia encephala]
MRIAVATLIDASLIGIIYTVYSIYIFLLRIFPHGPSHRLLHGRLPVVLLERFGYRHVIHLQRPSM